MIKIHEEIIVIKFSKLVKEGADVADIVNADIAQSIAAVAEELAGNGVVVEVEQAQ